MHIALADDRPDALVRLSDTLNEYAARNGLHFDLHLFSSGEALLDAHSSCRFLVRILAATSCSRFKESLSILGSISN